MSTFIETIKEYKKQGHHLDEDKLWSILENLEEMLVAYEVNCADKFWDIMRELHEDFKGEHFDELYAKHEVSKMMHTSHDGRTYKGEKFDISKAQEVHSKYRGLLKAQDSVCDVYVAINSHYHRYNCLFKNWFAGIDEETLHTRVIEAAIKYWFQDENCLEGGKVWKHFKNLN